MRLLKTIEVHVLSVFSSNFKMWLEILIGLKFTDKSEIYYILWKENSIILSSIL